MPWGHLSQMDQRGGVNKKTTVVLLFKSNTIAAIGLELKD
ncbi:Uncharacterised protein [Chlamydia trachomatis]|nr:Uncharacterised protein [Chlamydia trachomatis]